MNKSCVTVPTQIQSVDHVRLSLREIEPLYISGHIITLTCDGQTPEECLFSREISADYELSGCTLRDKIELYRRRYAPIPGEFVSYWITDADFNKCFC